MCLMPSSPLARCKPSERALKLGQSITLCNYVILLACVGMMIGGDFSQLPFTIILIVVGWCSMRESPNVHKIDKVQCYCLLCGYLVVTTVVHVIYVIINPDATNVSTGWSQKVAIVSNFLGVFFFAAGCYFAKQLYDELRLNYVPPDPEFQEQPGLFGRRSQPNQQTQNNRRGGFGEEHTINNPRIINKHIMLLVNNHNNNSNHNNLRITQEASRPSRSRSTPW
eukprot:UN29806